MLLTGLVALIFHLLDLLFFSWWYQPFLSALQNWLVVLDHVNSTFMVVLNATRFVTYFVPVTHITVIVSVMVAYTFLKIGFSLYNAIAQIIP